jgi:hypothetical protein
MTHFSLLLHTTSSLSARAFSSDSLHLRSSIFIHIIASSPAIFTASILHRIFTLSTRPPHYFQFLSIIYLLAFERDDASERAAKEMSVATRGLLLF